MLCFPGSGLCFTICVWLSLYIDCYGINNKDVVANQVGAVHFPYASSAITDAKTYRKTSNIRRTLADNKIVDHSDVVGAWPVDAASTTSSFST